MKFEKILYDLISSLEHSDIGMSSLGFINYIESFRTVGLIVPRRSGKTSTLLKLFSEYSSLMFVKNNIEAKNNNGILKYSDLSSIPNRFIGISNTSNLKYQCFLLDDYQFMTNVQHMYMNELLVNLKHKNMLTKDFFILKLTT